MPFGQSRYRKKTIAEIRTANAEKARRYYHKKKAELGIDPIRLYREERKKEIVNLLGGKCQICGYNRTMRNLAFHHLLDKKFPISSRSFQFAMKMILEEVRKCILVCHNCHGEIHDKLVAEEVILRAHNFVVIQIDLYQK